MNIQAAFLMAGHSQLRLVMDNCVVTLEPNAASVPRYMFVQNQGSVSYGTFPELWKQDNYITSKFANILCPDTILLNKILNEQFIYYMLGVVASLWIKMNCTCLAIYHSWGGLKHVTLMISICTLMLTNGISIPYDVDVLLTLKCHIRVPVSCPENKIMCFRCRWMLSVSMKTTGMLWVLYKLKHFTLLCCRTVYCKKYEAFFLYTFIVAFPIWKLIFI